MSNIQENIVKRRSIRSFDGQSLSDEEFEMIGRLVEEASSIPTPFGNQPIINTVRKVAPNQTQSSRMGTYGVIKGEAGFLICSSAVDEHAIVDAGFALEHIVLRLTGLDIGTCWLGGTFKRQDFLIGAGTDHGLIIPAVIPFGRPKDRARIMDSFMRRVAGSDSRKDWSELFFINDMATSLPMDSSGVWREVLEMVRVGPSASNKQPWRIVLNDDMTMAHVFIQQTPRYAGNSFGYDMQMLDAGIALCHATSMLKQLSVPHSLMDSDPGFEVPEGVVYIKTIKIK